MDGGCYARGTSTGIKVSLRSRSHADFLCHVREFAAFQNHATERELRCNVRRREWFAAGDDEVKSVRRARSETGLVLGATNHPARHLSHHPALLIKEEADGADRLNSLSEIVLHGQRHHGLLSGNFHRRHRDGKLREREQRAEQQSGGQGEEIGEFLRQHSSIWAIIGLQSRKQSSL